MIPNKHHEVSEEVLRTYNNEQLITYYEGKLGSLERKYSDTIETTKQKEKKLQEHLEYLTNYKEKLVKCATAQQAQLKEYSFQLSGLRSNFGSERFINQFQKEVVNLKDKEEAFKKIHLANLRCLKEENQTLRAKNRSCR